MTTDEGRTTPAGAASAAPATTPTPTFTRRRVLQAVGAGVAALGAAQVGATPAWSIIRSRAQLALDGPDVYVVTLDDCSPEYIGYYRPFLPTAYPGPLHTPELDAMLAASWTSSSARAAMPVCASSRSAFLTGSTPEETGVLGVQGMFVTPLINQFLAKVQSGELVALPGFLTGHGRDTAARGKVDHTGQLMALPGQLNEVGTFSNVGALIGDPAYSPGGFAGVDGSFLPYGTLPPGVTHVDTLRVDEQIARIAAPYSGQRVDFLGFVMPHVPRTVHQEWLDLYDPSQVQLRTTAAEIEADIEDIPDEHLSYLASPLRLGIPLGQYMETVLTEEQRKEHVRHMLATVSHTSHQLGRLMNALTDAGRPFVVVLTADHGYHLGEKGHWEKSTLYDKALLTPLAIYSSEAHPSYPVGNHDWPVSLHGLARTVAHLAGIEDAALPPQWGGVRFDQTDGNCTSHVWGYAGQETSRAAVFRTAAGRTFKLIVHPSGATEVYNLTDDPGEIDNLTVPNAPAGVAAADEPTRVAWNAEAHADLDLRGRRERAADWKARRRAGRRST